MSEGTQEYHRKIGERITRNQTCFHDLRSDDTRSTIPPLRSIVFRHRTKSEKKNQVTLTHNPTIPPTQLSNAVSSLTTFAIRPCPRAKTACCMRQDASSTAYDGVYDTISTAGIVPVPERAALKNISPRVFRRRLVRYWHPLGCRANRPWKIVPGGVWCTPSYKLFQNLGQFLCSRIGGSKKGDFRSETKSGILTQSRKRPFRIPFFSIE